MSALGKAAAKFEAAFTGLPSNVQQAVMLAMYRAAPAIAQYQKDLAPLTESEEILDAVWDILLAGAVKLAMKGKDGIGARQLEEMQQKAPKTFEFLQTTGKLIEGMLPGMPTAPVKLPPRIHKLLEGAPPQATQPTIEELAAHPSAVVVAPRLLEAKKK